jgi:hypothetical protein
MTIEVLIQAIVRQTTVLIAQLATSWGTRAPLAQVASQVFLDLVNELEAQGVSRKVSADMFGMGLRTYQRKIQRLTESSTERGRSLWEAVLEYIRKKKMTTRADIRERFSGDEEVQIRGVLHDLCDSGLVFYSGHGPGAVYRAASDDELGALRQFRTQEGLDEILWAIVYREGPVTEERLASLAHLSIADVASALARLVQTKRIERVDAGEETVYRTSSFLVPLNSPIGWEAAIFDHFQAMVKTISCRLREDATTASRDCVGGSTYTLDVWPEHPLEAEARAALAQLRGMIGDLRRRIEEFNAANPPPERHTQVVLYVGQCLIPQGQEEGP